MTLNRKLQSDVVYIHIISTLRVIHNLPYFPYLEYHTHKNNSVFCI